MQQDDGVTGAVHRVVKGRALDLNLAMIRCQRHGGWHRQLLPARLACRHDRGQQRDGYDEENERAEWFHDGSAKL